MTTNHPSLRASSAARNELLALYLVTTPHWVYTLYEFIAISLLVDH